MTNTTIILENFQLTEGHFFDGNCFEKILEMILEQEKPIKIYEACEFNDVLVIEKKENRIRFSMNVMTQSDRKKINEIADTFVERLKDIDKGKWLYDLKNDIPLYDYQTRKLGKDSRWGFYYREGELKNILAIDGDLTTPIRLYNYGYKSSLYWAIYIINKHFSNPMGNLADVYGTEVALNFACRLYNIKPYENFYANRAKIIDSIQIFEKDEEEPLEKNHFETFNKIYRETYEKEEEEIDPKKVEKENEKEVSLVLSEKGEIFLSDIKTYGILGGFFPVSIDMVLDPRVIGAYLEENTLVFITAVSLDDRAKKNIADDFKEIGDIEFVMKINLEEHVVDSVELFRNLNY